MAVNWSTPADSARAQAGLAQIDANASPATMEIGSAGMAQVLVVLTLAKPSFIESGGVLTMAAAPRSGIASLTGTAAAARIKDGGGTVVVSGLTVGTSGTDIVLNSTAINNFQTVTLNSFSISPPP